MSSRRCTPRHGHGLQISEVILELSVETRGPEHSEHTLDTLRRAGFEPILSRRLTFPPTQKRPRVREDAGAHLRGWSARVSLDVHDLHADERPLGAS